MLSVFILYSNDRKSQAELMIGCLSECIGFNECEKILCADGSTNYTPEDFLVLEIERPDTGFYCWAKAWQQAVKTARHEKVLYLDCDRILPVSALLEFANTISENQFVFPRYLYSFEEDCSVEEVRATRDQADFSKLRPDHRVFTSAWEAVRAKNPMSGCVGFTRTTFIASGGLDPDFQGWGYPDTDYFAKTQSLGMRFVPLEMNELHLKHHYEKPSRVVKAMNLWNGCRFCRKWGYPIHPKLHTLAGELSLAITRVEKYKKLEDFLSDLQKADKIL